MLQMDELKGAFLMSRQCWDVFSALSILVLSRQNVAQRHTTHYKGPRGQSGVQESRILIGAAGALAFTRPWWKGRS